MSFISNLRNTRKIKSYSKQNDDVFAAYLKTDLSEDQLQGVIDIIDHPEIYKPLITHVSDLVKQPNFNSDMKNTFMNKLESLKSDKDVDAAISVVKASDNELLDKLNVHNVTPKLTMRERISAKIKSTYDDIADSARTRYTKTATKVSEFTNKVGDRIDNIMDKVDEKVDAVGNATKPAVDMAVDRVKHRYAEFRDEYRVRKVTLENNTNLSKALDNGMTAEKVAAGFEFMDVPEIQYGMINNVDKILALPDMTDDIVSDYYFAAAEQVEKMPNNKLRQKFESTFEAYFNDNQTMIDDDIKEVQAALVETKPEPIVNDGKPDIKTYTMESDDTWTAPTETGVATLSAIEVEQQVESQYPGTAIENVMPPMDDNYLASLESAGLPDERDNYSYEGEFERAFEDGLNGLPPKDDLVMG